jgi:class 3 adenylate cyclase
MVVGAAAASERPYVMQQEQVSSSSATRTWWRELSKPARAAFVCSFPMAFGAVVLEAILGDSLGPEHPLSIARLLLRLGCFVAAAVNLAIVGIGSFRAWRRTTRQRQGLCPTCGYDVRTASERCPECGSPLVERAAAPDARRTATILLTDITDFTLRADDSSRDDALSILRRQREIVQPIVRRRAGRIIKSTGDGLIASFDSATDAVLAAAEIQNAVGENNRNAFRDGDKLLLRIAVSTGEVAFMDNDVLGQPVNLASRVQQLARPGEVYFTDSTFHAMNRKEIAYDDLGLVGVKGFSEKVNLYRYRLPAPAAEAM